MNQEIKALWVGALRSGDYVQGKSNLANTNGEFCCLGVLCDLAEKAGGIIGGKSASTWGTVTYDEETAVLPSSVKEWAALPTCNPIILRNVTTPHGTRNFTLAELNDGSDLYDLPRRTFAEIADLIERKL